MGKCSTTQGCIVAFSQQQPCPAKSGELRPKSKLPLLSEGLLSLLRLWPENHGGSAGLRVKVGPDPQESQCFVAFESKKEAEEAQAVKVGFQSPILATLGIPKKTEKWLWLKKPVPKMGCPGKWKHGQKPAVCPSDRFILSHTQMSPGEELPQQKPLEADRLEWGMGTHESRCLRFPQILIWRKWAKPWEHERRMDPQICGAQTWGRNPVR